MHLMYHALQASPQRLHSATLQVFMNMATGGFRTEVTVKTDPKMKQQLGGAAYIITGDTLYWQ